MSAAPINKVAEAVNRRKFNQFKQWQKNRKKISTIAESADMTEGSKKRVIEKLYRSKDAGGKKPAKKLIFAKKGQVGTALLNILLGSDVCMYMYLTDVLVSVLLFWLNRELEERPVSASNMSTSA